MKIKVIKSDGTTEDYYPIKIAKVVIAAGLNPNQTQTVVENVTNWAQKTGKPQITTLEIRSQVIEEMRKIDVNAANLFEWYEKTKDKDPASIQKVQG